MLYSAYQTFCDALEPSRRAAGMALSMRGAPWMADFQVPWMRRMLALADGYGLAAITHKRPPFYIDSVDCGNARVAVVEEETLTLPFGRLIHFAKPDIVTPQPRMLVVAPLSGHFATLLRGTVQTLLRDHDVYITDWANARDVPMSAGRFGVDEYVDYVIRFIQELGPRSHVLAVCQPCVPVLAAVAVMAARNDPLQPRSMTLMGGPVDVRESPTAVNHLATSKPMRWFEDNLISTVPGRHGGAGRKVYPGFMQLTAFMSMNLGRHFAQFRKFYQHLADDEPRDAARIRDFYEEYMAVLDLTAEFYLETVEQIFQRASLARGEMRHHGVKVDCGAIRRTALLTVEGERDDICGVGQTAAAHHLCSSLRPHLKRHHLQPGVGHYGVFSGSKWERQVYPQVRSLVLAVS
ncbi:MAG: polyhydroxyalkanoate depolymerase [Sphingomonadales bacterium]|nr:polyhydroxyalkanoate depolymerase [Sphingomonadales bacterium]MDE2168697.1 polyhydroxyalkanoate depolymerase [Sphingomonadales bacterium]